MGPLFARCDVGGRLAGNEVESPPRPQESPVTPDFWRGRRVLVTGHTGFKGTWLSVWLDMLGSQVFGYALDPPTQPSLYEQAGVA